MHRNLMRPAMGNAGPGAARCCMHAQPAPETGVVADRKCGGGRQRAAASELGPRLARRQRSRSAGAGAESLTAARCLDGWPHALPGRRRAACPHVEQAAEVCAEEYERFLIDGFELSPSYPARLRAALEGTAVWACFLGHEGFAVEDLVGYRGPKPQHHGASREELRQAAAWIRRRSRELRQECAAVGVPYVDVGEVGFEAAMVRARGHLLARG